MRLVFASTNQGKINELQKLFESSNLELLTSNDDEVPNLDVPETGDTFHENAHLKALAFSETTLLPSLADDSGLSVAALNGEPGVASARWHDGTDHDRNEALLKRMEGVTDRSAEFITVVCFFDPETNTTEFFEGVVSGTIALEPMGDEGFGYDPIFIPDGYSKTFAELGVDTKNQLSHRYKAFTKFKQYLLNSNRI